MTRALICGVSGQDGAYLARLLVEKGYEVWGSSRDAQMNTFGNLAQLGVPAVKPVSMALNDFRSVLNAIDSISPDEIYNLAGQSSVGLSFDQPAETLESITTGTLNILECIRFLKKPIRLYNAGSSECFGDTGREAASELSPFQPRSPYAVAKAAAHWLVSNYREAYGVHACTGILFNHESPLRPKRFVTQKIIQAALAIADGRADSLVLGNLAVHRDWGWAPEYVDAMWRMLQIEQAQDFVIATGQSNSLQSFVEAAFAELGLDWQRYVRVDASLLRRSEIAYSCGNAAKAEKVLGWRAETFMHGVVKRMLAGA